MSGAVCCSLLQAATVCVVAHESAWMFHSSALQWVLQCVAVCCSVLRDFTNKYPCCNKHTPLFCCHSLRSVLQGVAVYGSVLQCVAGCCSVLLSLSLAWQCVAVCCSVLQCVAVCCSMLQCGAVEYSVLQCVAVGFFANESHFSLYYIQCCSVLQCVAGCCSCSVLRGLAIPSYQRWSSSLEQGKENVQFQRICTGVDRSAMPTSRWGLQQTESATDWDSYGK